MLSFLLDLLFPRKSLTGDEGAWITDSERRSMRLFPVRLQKELLQKKEIFSVDCLIAAGQYQSSPLLQKAIRTFKYARIPSLGPELATHIVDVLPGLLSLPENARPVLCPVPLHWTRRYERGFNQAHILAESIGIQQGWPVMHLLKRTRSTGHQAWRKRSERLTAVTNAFALKQNNSLPACVILIDDICTTGATLDACAKTLKNDGVQCVIGLVVAYG